MEVAVEMMNVLVGMFVNVGHVLQQRWALSPWPRIKGPQAEHARRDQNAQGIRKDFARETSVKWDVSHFRRS